MTEYEFVRLVFVFAALSLIGTGFHVARKVTKHVPEYVRIAILAPALAGILYLIGLIKFSYVPYWHDVFAICATLIIYSFVASLFTQSPWIDFTNKETE